MAKAFPMALWGSQVRILSAPQPFSKRFHQFFLGTRGIFGVYRLRWLGTVRNSKITVWSAKMWRQVATIYCSSRSIIACQRPDSRQTLPVHVSIR